MKLIAWSALAVASAEIPCEEIQNNYHREGIAVVCPDLSNGGEDANLERRQRYVECFGNGEHGFTNDVVLEICAEISAQEIEDAPIDRFLGGGSHVMLQSVKTINLRNYGCWCNTASDWKVGRGEPVDGMDTVCRNVHHSYKCLAAEGCEKDLPWITGPERTETGWALTCAVNGDGQTFPDPDEAQCAVKACTIGNHLLSSMNNLFMGGNSISPDNVHTGFDFVQTDYMGNQVGSVPGDFNFDDMCIPIQGVRDVKCCGPYPFRREYDINTAECCVENGFEKIRGCGMCFEDDLVYPKQC